MTEDEEFDNMKTFPIWKEKYSKMGVTPRELYMRQQGLCWLTNSIDPDGKVIITCTDGEDSALTENMLNPTIECVRCMTTFTSRFIEDVVNENKSKEG